MKQINISYGPDKQLVNVGSGTYTYSSFQNTVLDCLEDRRLL